MKEVFDVFCHMPHIQPHNIIILLINTQLIVCFLYKKFYFTAFVQQTFLYLMDCLDKGRLDFFQELMLRKMYKAKRKDILKCQIRTENLMKMSSDCII